MIKRFVFNCKRRKISLSDCKTQVLTKIISIVLSNTIFQGVENKKSQTSEHKFFEMTFISIIGA